MRVKTSELAGPALDWAVAKCEGLLAFGWQVDMGLLKITLSTGETEGFQPSTNWALGGPIIEREEISVIRLEDGSVVDDEGYWVAGGVPRYGAVIGEYFSDDILRTSCGEHCGDIYQIGTGLVVEGPTPLIAAMRCFVASQLGDEVDVPDAISGETA
jgi:hypothetical protein